MKKTGVQRRFDESLARLNQMAVEMQAPFESVMEIVVKGDKPGPRRFGLNPKARVDYLVSQYRVQFYETEADELAARVESLLLKLPESQGKRKVALHEARVQGGNRRGEQQRDESIALRARIIELEAKFRHGGVKKHFITKKIAAELQLSVDHVRKVRSAYNAVREKSVVS